MKRVIIFFGIAALGCFVAARSADQTLPTELQRAAKVTVSDHKGIIAYTTTWDSTAHGGPMHRTYHYTDAYVFKDERLIKARAMTKGDNGKIATQQELDTETLKIETEQGNGKVFAVPFDARHFSEYHYAKGACVGCGNGDTKITFSSLVKDAFHGDGSMIVDSSGHVKVLSYSPKVLPLHATTGVITAYRAEVLPGFWATVRSEERFTGHLGPFSGGAEIQSYSDHYHRFQSVEAALAALRSGAI